MRERLEHFKWVLVDQVSDLTIATIAIRNHIASDKFDPHSQHTLSYFRMCTSSLIISLSKLSEVIKHYGKEINGFPRETRVALIKLKQEIEKKKIYQFRSKYAAHVIDKATNMPLSLAEGERRYKEIVGKDTSEIVSFCDWICPENYAQNSSSVISVILETRDHIVSIVGGDARRP